MFEKLPKIPTVEEIIDQAFRRASRISIKDIKDPLKKSKSLNISKINTVKDIVKKHLDIVDEWPFVDKMHPFYRDLLSLLVGIDNYKKSLSDLNWARNKIESLWENYKIKIRKCSTEEETTSVRREFYGRVVSILKDIEDSVNFLIEAREKLRKLPTVDPNEFCVVVAGYPNVGKSLLVKRISSAEPEVASYPFTTKGIIMGHMNCDPLKRIAIIDTPGLLDRPPEKMNSMEKQALLALKHLAKLIIFIVDPTEHCGYPLQSQKSLLQSLHKIFEGKDFLVIENKADIKEIESPNLKISALTGKNLDKLIEIICEKASRKI